MARTYFNRNRRLPIFTNERGVGTGMANDRTDVMLIQLLLRAIMHGNKALPGTRINKFTRPIGPSMGVHGLWDEASKNYLKEWEVIYLVSRMEAQGWGGPDFVQPETAYPGKVVPYAAGGKKVLAMCRMCAIMFGDTAYASLALPDTSLPDVLAKELFYTG